MPPESRKLVAVEVPVDLPGRLGRIRVGRFVHGLMNAADEMRDEEDHQRPVLSHPQRSLLPAPHVDDWPDLDNWATIHGLVLVDLREAKFLHEPLLV